MTEEHQTGSRHIVEVLHGFINGNSRTGLLPFKFFIQFDRCTRKTKIVTALHFWNVCYTGGCLNKSKHALCLLNTQRTTLNRHSAKPLVVYEPNMVLFRPCWYFSFSSLLSNRTTTERVKTQCLVKIASDEEWTPSMFPSQKKVANSVHFCAMFQIFLKVPRL